MYWCDFFNWRQGSWAVQFFVWFKDWFLSTEILNSNIVMGIYIYVSVSVWFFWLIQGLVNMETELSENLRCLFVYISKLPLYECHLQCFQLREGFSVFQWHENCCSNFLVMCSSEQQQPTIVRSTTVCSAQLK